MSTLFLIAAVVGGTILVCQFALTLLGLGHDGGNDVGHHFGGEFHGGDAHVGGDAHAGGVHDSQTGAHQDAEQHTDSTQVFSILSFRTVVAALAFFGVAGEAALSAGYAPSTSLILAIIAGGFAMYGMYNMVRLIAGLNSSGNERIGNAVGRQAVVYIPIPPSRSGAGKVQFSMQNRIVEYLAMTDDAGVLRTGESVEIVGVSSADTLTVRKSNVPVHVEPVAVPIAAITTN
jgi:hypothetical protein